LNRLVTWTDSRTSPAPIDTIASNGIVREAFNYSIGANQYAIPSVEVDLILGELNTRTTNIADIPGANTICTIQRDIAGPNSNGAERCSCGISENAVGSIVGKD
jgi:hypothetical protein